MSQYIGGTSVLVGPGHDPAGDCERVSFHECMGMNTKQKIVKAAQLLPERQTLTLEDASSKYRKANSKIFKMSPFFTNPEVPPKHELVYFHPFQGRFSVFFCN